ncbi:MAG: GNAT family N-acetyltransferase [Cloacibacterium sp.]|jgi:GNAT superfamily N-acetyltransferase|nr:GNAT family N-acetyltransferase [Cloacibacterium sp.]
MKFLSINSFEAPLSQEIYISYCQSFPEDERRDFKQFQELFNHKKVDFLSIVQEEQNIGYLILWKLNNFAFVEHFEVFNEFRGQNFGTQILKEISEFYPRIVLETEPEHLHEVAKRRVLFYRRNGFDIIDYQYIQPSYSREKNALPLLLLANFATTNSKKYVDEIYSHVYKTHL